MNSLLGLNDSIAGKISATELSAYRMVNRLFIGVIILSAFSCGYFGYLLTGQWKGVLLFAVLIGFIHFCILRISLITMMTKPLCYIQEGELPQGTISGTRKRFNLNLADITRYIFVGLIGLTIAVPISAIFYHDRGEAIEERHRNEMFQTASTNHHLSSTYQDEQIDKAHFPFIIFSELSHDFSYKILCLLFTLFVFSPIILLQRIRGNVDFKYMELCREEMKRVVQIDYDETLEQSQYYIREHFPTYQKKLTDLTVYADAPFNVHRKAENNLQFSSRHEFLKSLMGS
jgi:hypothetical protein